eukprot:2634350-Alexandrium_andersonii.AAC.1
MAIGRCRCGRGFYMNLGRCSLNCYRPEGPGARCRQAQLAGRPFQLEAVPERMTPTTFFSVLWVCSGVFLALLKR